VSLDNTPQQLHARGKTVRFWLPRSLSVVAIALEASALVLMAGARGDMRPAALRQLDIGYALVLLGQTCLVFLFLAGWFQPASRWQYWGC
jgi:hypothetical protein